MINKQYRKGSLSSQLAGEDYEQQSSLMDSPYYRQSMTSHYQTPQGAQADGSMGMEGMPMMPMGGDYGMFGGSSGAAAGGEAGSLGGASASSGSTGGASSAMGSLGPVAAIMAAVAASKAVEANQSPDSGFGKFLGSVNAPSINQIKEDPKIGVTTAIGIPFINGFIRNDKAASARPEWESLFS